MRLASAVVTAAVLCSACATSGPKTPTGRPELIVPGVTIEEARNRILVGLAERGYTLEQSSTNLVSAVRLNDNVGASLLLGSSYDTNVYSRVQLTLAEMEGKTRIYGSFAALSNYGSAFQRVTDLSTGGGGLSVQQWLEKLFPEHEPLGLRTEEG